MRLVPPLPRGCNDRWSAIKALLFLRTALCRFEPGLPGIVHGHATQLYLSPGVRMVIKVKVLRVFIKHRVRLIFPNLKPVPVPSAALKSVTVSSSPPARTIGTVRSAYCTSD